MYRKLDKLVISLFLIFTWSLTVNAASLLTVSQNAQIVMLIRLISAQ